MEEVEDFFKEAQENFTIYVVEQKFAVGRGNDYFKSYKGKDNFISTNQAIKKRISIICKVIPNLSDLIRSCISIKTSLDIIEVITSLSKLFSLHEHQAAGPEVLDPIIIQEGDISEKYLSQIITLHKESILQPVIIIILRDNDFDRAKSLLSKCPHGINVKMIRNSGKSEIYKVLNIGSDDINSFLDSYSRQCFSTCSRTKRDILTNETWSNNSIVSNYSPLIFKVRSTLLLDDKEEVREDLNLLLNDLKNEHTENENDMKIRMSLECMIKLFKVFCYDYGGQDIIDSYFLAHELDNDLLKAHVYRYASFLKNHSEEDKRQLLLNAYKIFYSNNIEDHAIYCMNNYLIRFFKAEKANLRGFKELKDEALHNTPGLVGMSIIYNNTGVAYLYSGFPDEAFECFTKGLAYARDRIIQKLALMSNILIAKASMFQRIDEIEIRKVIHYIFETCKTTRLPFVTANFVMNLSAIALKQHPGLIRELISIYPIHQLLCNAFSPGQLDSGTLGFQFLWLKNKYPEFDLEGIRLPEHSFGTSGIRQEYVMINGYDPTIFSAWL